MGIRNTQQPTEVYGVPDDLSARITQQAVEVYDTPDDLSARITQLAVEVWVAKGGPFKNLQEFIMTEGKTYNMQAGTVWLRKSGSLNAATWGGGCMRLEDIVLNTGGLTVTQKQDPRGGLEPDGVLLGSRTGATSTLIMKRKQFDKRKTELLRCLWDFTMRMTCDGTDLELFNSWEEATLISKAKITTRTMSGTQFMGEDGEQMITLALSAFDNLDYYRLSGEEDNDLAGTLSLSLVGVTSAKPEGCPTCDPEEECVLYASTEGLVSDDPYVLYNIVGGETSAWAIAAKLIKLGAAGDSLGGIVGFGDFFCVANASDAQMVYSDDRGATHVPVTIGTQPSASPNAIDAINASYIIQGCDGGDIYSSVDQARTWVQVAAGLEDAGGVAREITGIRIARDNPQVIYAIGALSDDIWKTTNGAGTWYRVGSTGSAAVNTAIRVINQNTLLVGDNAGNMYQSLDGGLIWALHTSALPGTVVPASTTIKAIEGLGDGREFVVTFEAAVGSKVYQSLDGGADGKWTQPENNTSGAVTTVWQSIALCDQNRAVVVGGLAATTESALLLA